MWQYSVGLISHLVIITIISAGWDSAYLALTVFTVFVTLITIAGPLQQMDQWKAVIDDSQENEADLHIMKLSDTVQWGMFKGLVVCSLGLTALAEIYLMWMA
jgi:hypothetical protein